MGKFGYFFAKCKYRLCGRNNEIINKYFRKKGISIGSDTHIFSDISGAEGYLIKIGDNVTISNNVTLVTHDASVRHYIKNKTDVFGCIEIGNNVFVGINSTIMPGVTIADHCIIGAGSVITKSIHEKGTVWAGNPARAVSTVEKLREKNECYAVDLNSADNRRELIEHCKKIEK